MNSDLVHREKPPIPRDRKSSGTLVDGGKKGTPSEGKDEENIASELKYNPK